MKKLMYLGVCLSMLFIGITAFASPATDCRDECQKEGDSYYSSCHESVAEGERPEGLINLGPKFVPPEEGYPRQEYCLRYAQTMTKDCYAECPKILISFGPENTHGYYTRDDVVDPEIEAKKKAEDDKTTDCLVKSGPKMDLCYDNFKEGAKRDACLEKVYDWQAECIYGN